MQWIKAFRLPNLVIIAITQLVVKYGLINPYFHHSQALLFPDKHFALLIATTVCLALFAYLINDYFDFDLDRINDRKCKMNIAKNSLWKLSWLVAILGFIIAIFLAIQAELLYLLWIYPLACLVLYIYSWKLKSKGLLGNIVVALFTSFVIFVTMLAETNIRFADHQDIFIILISFLIFSFLVNLYREIIKDIEDIIEDQALGLQTLPIRIGKERAKLAAFFIGLFLIVLVINFGVFIAGSVFQKSFIFLCIALALVFVLFLNYKARSTQDYHLISRLLKVVMVFGLFYLTFAL